MYFLSNKCSFGETFKNIKNLTNPKLFNNNVDININIHFKINLDRNILKTFRFEILKATFQFCHIALLILSLDGCGGV